MKKSLLGFAALALVLPACVDVDDEYDDGYTRTRTHTEYRRVVVDPDDDYYRTRTRREIVVRHPVPERRVERVTTRTTRPGYVWVPGHYDWRGDNWVWISGTQVRPPVQNATWVNSTYVRRGDRTVYVPGYWNTTRTTRVTRM